MVPQTSKNRLWFGIIGLLSVAVLCVMAVLAYLLFTLPASTAMVSPTPGRPRLSLPTAPLPTTTPGRRRPMQVRFVPQEPIKGFANCDSYGFRGKVTTRQDNPLAGIQIVVWQEEGGGLLALDTTDQNGTYTILIRAKPAPRQLWVQLYENDRPVSEPILLKTQIDCQNGFQIFQLNWQELPPAEESP
jgi:hypothetical protein